MAKRRKSRRHPHRKGKRSSFYNPAKDYLKFTQGSIAMMHGTAITSMTMQTLKDVMP